MYENPKSMKKSADINVSNNSDSNLAFTTIMSVEMNPQT